MLQQALFTTVHLMHIRFQWPDIFNDKYKKTIFIDAQNMLTLHWPLSAQ